MSKMELKWSAAVNRQKLTEYLMNLAIGFAWGNIHIQSSHQYLILKPDTLVSIKVKAKKKDNKQKYCIEIDWINRRPAFGLTITSLKPTV